MNKGVLYFAESQLRYTEEEVLDGLEKYFEEPKGSPEELREFLRAHIGRPHMTHGKSNIVSYLRSKNYRARITKKLGKLEVQDGILFSYFALVVDREIEGAHLDEIKRRGYKLNRIGITFI